MGATPALLEGTITIDAAKGKHSEKVSATITIRPNAGFHISTDYNTALNLTAPIDLALPVTQYKGGGRTHAKGDFETLSEQVLQAVVVAVPARAGTFTVTGTFRFGVCEQNSCHPKSQPITIAVIAE
jgi:hypothetical protein